jgi:formate dehydrogenase assembly factor FdhD
MSELAAVEEVPVWLEVNGRPVVTWMCTPDLLEELAIGWLHGRRPVLASGCGAVSTGGAFLAGRRLEGLGLLVTGRISAELAFKASRAGLSWVATPSVPSTLAVEIARRRGMVLVGRAVSGTPQRHGAGAAGAE